MKENYIYPVIIKKEENGGVLVTAPDFAGQMTEVKNETEAVIAAQEMLALCIIDNEEKGKDNPVPSEEREITIENDEKIIYVHLWMPYFRRIQKEVYVKKTLTIPSWLDMMAKEKNINFSAVLVKGLKKELGIDIR